jgi:hypothetical protein
MKRLLIILMLCSPAWASWSMTNQQDGASASNPASAAAFTNALTNPSLIVVLVSTELSSGTTIATPTGSGSGNGAFQDCGPGKQLYLSSAAAFECFYVLNTQTTASYVVSEPNSGGENMRVVAEEWTGGATSSIITGSPVGVQNQTTGTGGGQNETVGPTTPVPNGALIIGGQTAGGGTITAGAGFSGNYGVSEYMEYLVQSTAAAISATWNNGTNNESYAAVVVAFKPATGASGNCASCDLSEVIYPMELNP